MTTPATTVLVYSEDAAVRERVRVALGRVPDPRVGPVDYVEAADHVSAVAAVDAGGIDLCVLDGEAWPAGGLGLSRQLKNEIAHCPAIVVLIARRDDKWLASWSLADAVALLPPDPMELARTVSQLLLDRRAALPARRPGADVAH